MPIGAPNEEQKSTSFTIPSWIVLPLVLVSYIGYDQWQQTNRVVPAPQPVPVVPAPGQKTMADLVSPDAAVELANLYHAMAVVLYNDKARVEKPDETAVVQTIQNFYDMHQKAGQAFQQANKITGISAVNDPISNKLKVATGTLDPSKQIDDPAAPVRDSLIATCQQISQELDPRYAAISLNQFR